MKTRNVQTSNINFQKDLLCELPIFLLQHARGYLNRWGMAYAKPKRPNVEYHKAMEQEVAKIIFGYQIHNFSLVDWWGDTREEIWTCCLR